MIGKKAFVATLVGLVAMTELATGLSVQAQDGAQPDAEAIRLAREAYNAMPNTPGDGPYPATMEADATLPGHVIYRPADLSPFADGKLPVLVWGNGACRDDGAAHRLHLAQIASYGYLVVAAGHWRSGPGATDGEGTRREDGTILPPETSVDDVRAGLDWAQAEDARSGSKYFGKVDNNAFAVAGHSCGGLQAILVAGDPRIKTVLIHNSGVYNEHFGRIPNFTISKDDLTNFHSPVIYIQGGPSDIAFLNGYDDFKRVENVPIVFSHLPVGHGGTFQQPMGGAVAHVAVDWLEWQLKGDKVAARTFLGENCRLCTGTDWTIERKGF